MPLICNRLCEYFNQLVLEKCIHYTALDNNATIQAAANPPQGSATVPVAQMLPLSDETRGSHLLDSNKDNEGEKLSDRRVPTTSMRDTMDLDAPAGDEARWTMFGHLPTAPLAQMLPEAGKHNGLVHGSSGQKRAASFELDKGAAFEGDERSAKQQKVHDTCLPVVRVRLTAGKLRKLALASTDATSADNQSSSLEVPQKCHNPNAILESGHVQSMRPTIGDNCSNNTNASSVSVDPIAQVMGKQNTAVLTNDVVGVEGTTSDERCEYQTSSCTPKERNANDPSTSSTITRQNQLAKVVECPGAVPMPSRIKSVMLHLNAPLLIPEQTLGCIGIGVTRQVATKVQDPKTGEMKVVFGEDIHDKYLMPQMNVERADEASDKSKSKVRTQTAPSATNNDARSQTAETPSHETTVQGAVVSLELHLQGSNFQQIINVSLATSLSDLFSSVQKRMSRRLAGKTIQCLKIQLAGRGEQKNAYLIEKDDADTWEKFCDDAKATAVESEKTKGIAEAEVD
jgi:hypothetical protein